MESSEHYFKAKRGLVISSGILIVITTIGVDSGSPTGEVPIKLKDYSKIDIICFFIMLYFFIEMLLYWTLQNSEFRSKIQNKINYFISFFIFFISTVIWFKPNIIDIFVEYYDKINTLDTGLFSIITAAIAAATQLMTHVYHSYKIKFEIEAEMKMISIITKGVWILYFNPVSNDFNKKISFNIDGTIGEGNNNNEQKWRINRGLLELINSDGKIFSRFRFDEKTEKFVHTNDDDTLSIKSQTIVRAHSL